MQEFWTQAGETVTLIVVFVVFLGLLKKLGWGPALATIDERQKKIEDAFAEIKHLKAEAEKSHQAYEERLRGIEAEARTKIQEAVAEGRRVAAEIAEKAHADAVESAAKSKASIALELETARRALREEVINLTIHAAERLLRDRLTETRDRELVGAFIDEMEKKS